MSSSPASEAKLVGTARLPPADSVRAFRAALCERLERAGTSRDAWNGRVLLAAYELAASRGLRPTELARLRACDVSLHFGFLLLPHAKATRRGADPRPIPLGADLLVLLQPLILGLRLTGQDDAPILTEWSDRRLVHLSPVNLRRLGAAVTGWRLEDVPDVGDYRHLYASRRKALEQQAKEQAPAAYVRHRRWSASLGHAQSGGWSVFLPNRLDDERDALARLDERWPLPRIADILLRPPRLPRHRNKSAPAARSRREWQASDWATQGLELGAVELDRLPAAHERLWSFDWAGRLQIDRDHALAITLLIHLAGFGEVLAPFQALKVVRWDDVQLTDSGPTLALTLPDALGQLRVPLLESEALLFPQLRALGLEAPFASVSWTNVEMVLEEILGVRATLAELQRANHLVHLLTHDTEQIGYLLGTVGHKIEAAPDEQARMERCQAQTVLMPLISDLRCDSRLTLSELDKRLDQLFPDWRAWPLDDAGVLTPGLILATVRKCCSTPSRRDRRRSRSAHTLRWLVQELIRIEHVLGDRPVNELDAKSLTSILGNRHAETRARAAIHWLRLTCRQVGVRPPKRVPIQERVHFHSVEVPRTADVVRVLDSLAGEERHVVAIVLGASTIVRKSELAALKVRDVRFTDNMRFEIARAKGGKPAIREAPTPEWLCPLVPELMSYLEGRDQQSRLVQPLARRSGSADAIFGRIAYKLQALGIDWSPHLMRTIGATEANAIGEDRAVISRRLGHVLVKTTSISYVALDPNQLRTSAERLASLHPIRLTASAIAFLFGLSERRAKAIRARTLGNLEILAGCAVGR